MGPKKDNTKTRLLEAGRQRLMRQGLPAALEIKLTDVLDDVQMSTGAAYNIWRNQADFRSDLSLYIARSFEWADTTAVLEAIDALPATSTFSDWVDAVADTYFPIFVEGMHFYIVLHFWGVQDLSPELTQAIQDGYDLTHNSFKALYETAFERYGLEIIKPHTSDDITAMVTAALEGFALRHRFQPQRLDDNERHLFTELLQAIATNYLQPDPNRRPLL